MAVQPFGKNLDRQCPIVMKSTQLADNPAVIDFAQPDRDLNLARCGIAKMYMVHIRKDLVVRLSRVASTNVVADIQR